MSLTNQVTYVEEFKALDLKLVDSLDILNQIKLNNEKISEKLDNCLQILETIKPKSRKIIIHILETLTEEKRSIKYNYVDGTLLQQATIFYSQETNQVLLSYGSASTPNYSIDYSGPIPIPKGSYKVRTYLIS